MKGKPLARGRELLKHRQTVRRVQRRGPSLRFTPQFLKTSHVNSKWRSVSERQPKRWLDLGAFMCIEAGDVVQVLHGSDQGKQSVVLARIPRTNQVIVEGCNMTRTIRNPHRTGAANSFLYKTLERPIHVTNVALVDPVIKKPTRAKRRFTMTGACVRISKLSGCAMPEPADVKPAMADRRSFLQDHLACRTEKPVKNVYQEDASKRPDSAELLWALQQLQRAGADMASPDFRRRLHHRLLSAGVKGSPASLSQHDRSRVIRSRFQPTNDH